MTSPRSRLAAFGTLAALLGLLALSPAAPVSALDQDTIRVTESQTVEKEFPPLASMNPLPGLPSPAPRLNGPDACRQATHCDVIPLEIVVPPTLRPIDEFYVHVQLWWETSQLPSTDDSRPRQNANDLDLVVWDDPIPETGMPAEYSTSDTRPEALKLYRPTKGRYSIVVSNYVGANTGYRLKVEYKPESIVPPFESLAPEFTPVEPAPEWVDLPVEEPETPPAASADRSGGAPAPPPPALAPVETPALPAPLTPVAIDPDPDFGNFGDDAFDKQLAAPAPGVLAEKRVKALGPPKPASTSSLVFWLAIVPLVLIGAGGVWLSKKGSAVLNLR